MGAGALWLARASDRTARNAVGAVLLGRFAIIGANTVWDLFPGTSGTPTQFLIYAAPLLVFAALASWGQNNSRGHPIRPPTADGAPGLPLDPRLKTQGCAQSLYHSGYTVKDGKYVS